MLCLSCNGATISHCRAANAMYTLRSTLTGLPLFGHPCTAQSSWRIQVYGRGGTSPTESVTPTVYTPLCSQIWNTTLIHGQKPKAPIRSVERYPNSSWKHRELVKSSPALLSSSQWLLTFTVYHLYLSVRCHSAPRSSHWILLRVNWMKHCTSVRKYSRGVKKEVLLTISANMNRGSLSVN